MFAYIRNHLTKTPKGLSLPEEGLSLRLFSKPLISEEGLSLRLFSKPLKGLSLILFSLLICLAPAVGVEAAPAQAPIVVIHGHSSLANAGDRRFALSLSRHALRWLQDGGMQAELDDDRNLNQSLSRRKVAILIHCAQLNPSQMAALRGFSQSGGTLIACYSSTPALADLMGVRLGAYYKPTPGSFDSMRFAHQKPLNVPYKIKQSSANIMRAAAIPGRSTVLAEWLDRRGTSTGEAAWIQSDTGFWMTHILQADGSADAKGQLLMALSAARHPELWLPAAKKRLESCFPLGNWRGIQDGRLAAGKLVDSKQRQRASTALQRAEQTHSKIDQLMRDQRGAESWLLTKDFKQQLLTAYGSAQQTSKGEIRAVWDHSGQGIYPGDWPRTCRLLKNAGITDILVNVAGPGFAHCRLDALPRSSVYENEGDQLAACLRAAHALGIRVHAWLIAYSTTQATAHRLSVYASKGWLLQDTQGKLTNWLNPAHPGVRTMLAQASSELYKRYPIDGLHLDFIRYENYYESLGPDTRKAFEEASGRRISNWPAAAHNQPLFNAVVDWRVDQVTSLVAEIRRTQRLVAPGKWLTTAVLGKYPSCVEAVGQDWESWVEMGYVDYVMPMNYSENLALYTELVNNQSRTRRLSYRLVGGIGATAAESRLDAASVIDQVQILRKANASGFALFSLGTTLSEEILPILQLGLTAP